MADRGKHMLFKSDTAIQIVIIIEKDKINIIKK